MELDITQLINQNLFNKYCSEYSGICFLAFLPQVASILPPPPIFNQGQTPHPSPSKKYGKMDGACKRIGGAIDIASIGHLARQLMRLAGRYLKSETNSAKNRTTTFPRTVHGPFVSHPLVPSRNLGKTTEIYRKLSAIKMRLILPSCGLGVEIPTMQRFLLFRS